MIQDVHHGQLAFFTTIETVMTYSRCNVALPYELIFMKYGLLKDDRDTGYFLELNQWYRESHVVLTHIDKPYQVVVGTAQPRGDILYV